MAEREVKKDHEFTIGGKRFQLNKIDAMRQFHIVKRLGPVLGEIIPAAQQLKDVNQKKLSEEQKLEQFAKLITPMMNGISKMSDADSDAVIFGLCASVQMHQPEFNVWARVSNGTALSIDLPLPTLLQVAGRAFAFNLADFFSMAPQTSHGPK